MKSEAQPKACHNMPLKPSKLHYGKFPKPFKIEAQSVHGSSNAAQRGLGPAKKRPRAAKKRPRGHPKASQRDQETPKSAQKPAKDAPEPSKSGPDLSKTEPVKPKDDFLA